MGGLTFVVADDHPLFRGALAQALTGLGDTVEIVEAGTFEAAKLAALDRDDIDLILLDLSMPGASGLSGIVAMRGLCPLVPLVVVSAHDGPDTIRRAIDLGASGFISKSSSIEDIRTAVRRILDGDIAHPDRIDLGQEGDSEMSELIRRLQTLTPQQTRVLTMLASGLLNKQIAFELGVSEATVKAHVSAVLQKLDVESRTQAVIRLSRLGGEATVS